MTLLEIHGLRAAYGRTEVLQGVDLTINRGEIVGLLGPNGAGKTTAIRAIVGLIRPRAGQILFNGTDLAGMDPEQIARLGVATVPEGRRIFRTLTVAENLKLGWLASSGQAGLDRILERFPVLRDHLDRPAERLSGGEQQQLVIARALASNPTLLILDEPSFGLAPKLIDTVYQLLSELQAEGLTVLLVEQSAARAVTFCDRYTVLTAGRVTITGSRDSPGAAALLNAYLGRGKARRSESRGEAD